MAILYRIEGSIAFISILSSMLILFTFVFVKQIRKHPWSLVFFMSLSDFFLGSKYFATAVYNGKGGSESLQDIYGVCISQAVFSQFWSLSSMGWIGMICINLIVKSRNPFYVTQRLEKYYHLWVWGYAGATAIILALLDQFGKSGDGTCWIKQNLAYEGTNYYQLTVLIPLLFYFFLALLALFCISSKMYEEEDTNVSILEQEKNKRIARGLTLRMRLFVFIFILFWIGYIIKRVAQIYNYEPEYLLYLEVFSISGSGFANALVWLLNPSLFKGFKETLQRWFKCLKKIEERSPLLPQISHSLLEDVSQDFTQVDGIFRKAIISSLLSGILYSVESVNTNAFEHQKSFREIELKQSTEIVNDEGNEYVYLRDTSELEHLNISTSFSQIVKKGNPSPYSFKDYAPVIFFYIRYLCRVTSEIYLKSLDPEIFLNSLKDHVSEGKSDSFFIFSPDKNFIIKTISENELNTLREILPDYYLHLRKYPKSLLTKIYGLHTLKINNNSFMHVMIMNNVFKTKLSIDERYDLKGSWIDRSVKGHSENPSSLLGKDTDLKRNLNLTLKDQECILTQIEADTKFLSLFGIMDYSLLVGFHFNKQDDYLVEVVSLENPGFLSSDKKEFYFIGIIDILQKYDLGKKIERGFKVYILNKPKKGVSVQPVNAYRTRFVSFIKKIIQTPLPQEE